jgi:hypothetical protein
MKDGGNVWRERRGRKDSRIKTDKRGGEAGQQAVPLPPFVQRISFIHFTMHSKQMGERKGNKFARWEGTGHLRIRISISMGFQSILREL